MRSFDAALSEMEGEKYSLFTSRAGTAQKRKEQYTVHANTRTPVNSHSARFLARARTSSRESSATVG